MIGSIHVRGIKPGNHWIETRAVLFWQRQISSRDIGVGKRVIVEWRICIQIIFRRIITTDSVRPLLLQGYAEQGRSSCCLAHDLQEVLDGYAFLNIVRQMEVTIIELV